MPAEVDVLNDIDRPLSSAPSVPGRGDSFRPVRDRIRDWYCRGRFRACGRELLVVTGLPSGDRGEVYT